MRETSRLPNATMFAGFAARLRASCRVACAAALALALAGWPVGAQPSSKFSPEEQAAIKALVLQAIRENPEIVMEALPALQVRTETEVAQLIGQDANLRPVMREWPILGPDSEYAARASVAARAQGKYQEYHEAMMRSPGANEATARRVADENGLDLDRLAEDRQDPSVAAHIEQSRRLAVDLGITGTPSFVIGGEIVPGHVTQAELAALVAETRARESERP